MAETEAKHAADDVFRSRIERIRSTWPDLRKRLKQQLISAAEMQSMLHQAGVVTHPAQIGMGWQHHRRTVFAARYIRRRYTVLDILAETGLLNTAIEAVFGPGGIWAPDHGGLGSAAAI